MANVYGSWRTKSPTLHNGRAAHAKEKKTKPVGMVAACCLRVGPILLALALGAAAGFLAASAKMGGSAPHLLCQASVKRRTPSAADHNQGATVTDSESSTCNASGVTCRIGDVRGVGRARLFSQCGQDQYVAERFGLTERGGFFVEMGARDGVDDSNTKFFEETLGWRGLLVEARPAFAEPLSSNRPRAYVLHGAIARHNNCTTTMCAHQLVPLSLDGVDSCQTRCQLEASCCRIWSVATSSTPCYSY